MNIIEKIKQKGSNKEKISIGALKNPGCIPDLLEGLDNDKGTIRLGCEKVLRLISEQKPELLYPYYNIFVKLLDSENNFLKWGAIIIISNLASVDSKNNFEKIFEKYYAPVTDKTMITAANVIGNSWKIALEKPELTEKIVQEILKVEKSNYENKGAPSPECRNVACGHAIKSFDLFYDKIKNREPVVDFIKKQLNNTRAPVKKKAEKFLKKHRIDF
jgi:hypothetical protein